jgi:U3 small nucleolar RNA-associated protein 21
MPDRPAKKAKPNAQPGPSTNTPSTLPKARLFAPFRALGHICNHVPYSMFVHTPQGAFAKPTVNVVTSVGRSWMMWNMEKMTLVFVGELAGPTGGKWQYPVDTFEEGH